GDSVVIERLCAAPLRLASAAGYDEREVEGLDARLLGGAQQIERRVQTDVGVGRETACAGAGLYGARDPRGVAGRCGDRACGPLTGRLALRGGLTYRLRLSSGGEEESGPDGKSGDAAATQQDGLASWETHRRCTSVLQGRASR